MDFDAVSAMFNALDRELWLLTAQADALRGGLIATFVSRASLVPTLPRMMIGLAKHHFTHTLIDASRSFCGHLIEDEQLEWVWRFGLRSGRDGDKLHGLTVQSGVTGSPILVDATAWVDCRVESCMDTGDRTIYLAEVVDARVGLMRSPLTFKRLIELASPDMLQELGTALRRDSEIDSRAILAWRLRHATGPEADGLYQGPAS